MAFLDDISACCYDSYSAYCYDSYSRFIGISLIIKKSVSSFEMRSRQKSSQGSFQSDQEHSNNTFQYNSNPNLMEEGGRQIFSFQETQCQFCINKYIIFEQLKVLRDTVIAKNEKIKELETFIQKLSKMAFTESTDNQTYFDLQEKAKSQARERSESQDMAFVKMASDKMFSRSKISENRSKQSLTQQKLSSSSILSEMTITQKQKIKRQIKSELKKMNLSQAEQSRQKASPTFCKESSLRSKLMQIMNILPGSDSSPHLQSFRTESEPFQEGRVASIKQNNKLTKNRGLPKNGESSYEQSLRNTIKSQTSQKSKQLSFSLA